MRLEVSVPSLLRDCTGGQVSFPLEAATLREALGALLAAYPLLRRHLFTEQGQLRKHVLIYYNEDSLAWLDDWNIPLQEGDRLQVLQAVSGG
ncbi:Sulfur carrier protein CysO [Paenibacillus solanacearum]|uniref:Sulfur carrier protein CysO n=1 Tax=Paenibacillus solanacearum TaxID=2048548 RepID=A0A916K2W5_9BACL|nr:MoaD/ThiS family protein [Paenibacillus solanacearum]CAG7635265.1 Sulfur carrier protein CysO [Paenibacillus solanacearum]